jgi:hypothetical protein
MKRKSLIVIGLLATVATAQSPVTFKRDLKTASSDIYSLVTESKNSIEFGGSSQAINSNISMTMEFNTAASESETADVTIVTRDFKFESDSPMGQAPEMPKEMKSTGKIDVRNRITDVKAQNAPEGMAAMMINSTGGSSWMAMFVEFPDKAVNVADKWDMKIPPLPMMSDKETTVSATFKGEKDGAYWVSVEGSIPMNFDSSKMPGGGADAMGSMTMTGTMTMNNDVMIEKISGRTISVTSTMKFKANMDVQGMTIPMTGDVKSTMTRKK